MFDPHGLTAVTITAHAASEPAANMVFELKKPISTKQLSSKMPLCLPEINSFQLRS